uniref:TERF1-interacting nuclear factor 2 N-terminal domain-containing protein n=1 Tax=Anas platyrhynchos TaxID=8839 RepID=A0A8B9R6Z1_ANAPL
GFKGNWAGPWVPLRLALAGAWHALRGRSLGQFPRVLRVLEAVGRAAPAALHFRHWARLRLGLQAAVSTPPPPFQHPLRHARWPTPDPSTRGPQDLELVEGAQENFRQLVLELLGDSRRRASYLEVGAPHMDQRCLPVLGPGSRSVWVLGPSPLVPWGPPSRT